MTPVAAFFVAFAILAAVSLGYRWGWADRDYELMAGEVVDDEP